MAENKSAKSKRLGLIGGQTIFGIVLLLLLIAGADKSGIRTDWSLSGTYSLHPATERIIEQLPATVAVYGFWEAYPDSGSRIAWTLRNQRAVKEKLTLIEELSSKISFEFVDSAIDKPRLKQLETELGPISPLSIYVKGENNRQIKIPYTPSLDRTLENNLCSALLAIQQEQESKISILSGHGELRSNVNPADSLDILIRQFENNGFSSTILDQARLSKIGRIPQDSVLFIPGATTALGADVIQHIKAFLDAGGNALILADYRCPADLATLLRKRGVMLGNGIIAGKPEDIFSDQAAVRTPRLICSSEQSIIGKKGRYDRIAVTAHDGYPSMSPDHPVTTRCFSGTVLSPYSGEMYPLFVDVYERYLPDFKQRMLQQGTPPYVIEPLLMIAGPQIWKAPIEAANEYQEQPETTQAFLGIAMKYALGEQSVVTDNESRLVVFASRQMAADDILGQTKYANDLLMIDAINWLSFRQNSAEIPPASFTELQVDCSEDTLNALFAILVLIIPMVALGLAMLTWWDRR